MAEGPTMEDILRTDVEIVADPVRVPWRKACLVCVFRLANPQNIDEETRAELTEECRQGFDFYCLHQMNGDGFHQPCASANALYQGAR